MVIKPDLGHDSERLAQFFFKKIKINFFNIKKTNELRVGFYLEFF